MTSFFTERFTTIANYFATQKIPTGAEWQSFFSWSFWTEGYLGPISQYGAVSLAAVIIFLAVIFTWRAILKKRQRVTPVYDLPESQLTNIIILVIIMTPLYAFFRNTEMAYLSSRMVVFFTFLLILFWLVWVVIYLKRIAPSKRKAYLEKERFFRYLPKR